MSRAVIEILNARYELSPDGWTGPEPIVVDTLNNEFPAAAVSLEHPISHSSRKAAEFFRGRVVELDLGPEPVETAAPAAAR